MKQTIISKVNRSKKGTIFLPDSFLPIDTHYTSNVLSELCNDGKLVRVSFGIYIKPKISSFGPLMPTIEDVAKAIAKRDCAQILPTGTTAENYLGFSTQVPMNAVYLTSGTPRKVKIGNRTLTLKHSVPTTFAYKGLVMPILVLALKSIGQRNITDETLAVVYGVLKQHPEEATWRDDVALAPRWIRTIITKTKEKMAQAQESVGRA
jgi:hypothetical protein